MNEPISSIMTKDVITINSNQSLTDVRNIFTSRRIHHLPVVDEGKLTGIITTGDLWYSETAPSDYGKTKVKELMTTKIATLEPQQKIGVAAEVFLENLFHALPVVKGDELIGIVTSFDVLKYEFKKEYPMQEVS